jgi:NADH-quinone oxidoreductase subunit M
VVTSFHANVLSWVVFLPMLTALGLLAQRAIATSIFNSKGLPAFSWRAIAVLSSTFTFVLAAVGIWQGFDPEMTSHQLVERRGWIPSLGIHYFVGIDGISLVLIMLTSFVVPIAMLSSWKEVTKPLKSYAVFLLLLETGINGVLVSLNVIQLYFFWELTLVSSFFIVGRWGGTQGLRAAVKFLLFGSLSFFLMLIGTLVVYRLNFEQGGVANFDLVTLGDGVLLGLLETKIPIAGGMDVLWWQTQSALFAAFALAFAIRVPLIPLHGWYNDAQSEAPTSGSVILSALVLNLGAYAFLRIALPLFPSAVSDSAPWMSSVALLGIAAGGFFALSQRDVKRLLGCLALAHVNFVVLGVFSLKHHAVVGSVVQMLSFGLCISALFILFGFLAERRSTRELSEFGGLAKPMPAFAALLGVAILGQVGAPGTSGFVGVFLVFLGSFPAQQFITLLALSGMVLAAGALLRAMGKVMFGPLEPAENRGLIDLDLRERVVVLLLLVPVLWIGLYPNPILRRVEPPVSLLLNALDRGVEESRRGADALAAAVPGESRRKSEVAP